MEPMYYWLIIIVLLLIIEFFTMGLTTIWFAGGSLIAFFVAMITDNLLIQIIVCVVVSFVLLMLTRPIALKYLQKNRVKTNYETYPGNKVKVTATIDNRNDSGQVVFNGIEWTARSAVDNVVYKEGDFVVIKEVTGVKLIVNKGEIE